MLVTSFEYFRIAMDTGSLKKGMRRQLAFDRYSLPMGDHVDAVCSETERVAILAV
jgi:hypothetical protein